eukprot:CAMPEP_0170192530 /NCGR_PEP_ID=MMETSP0040_2-20121228/54450_1 /TAXON_ID=641309 /ORGANISM="Lotharella oceanica, Strain CCMP622" /LENGTH=36 /DNA_ID= /DNA_START= /DNA_END= /DNA_ORIENTATION=
MAISHPLVRVGVNVIPRASGRSGAGEAETTAGTGIS